MKKFLLVFFISGVLYAQSGDAYLIPRQIFVGDPATLVIPLPISSQNDTTIITALENSNLLPVDPHIDFHRIILEKRTTGSRLLIEFTAFSTGILELPIIEIKGEYFSGLSVTVNSLIDTRSAPVLSGAASVLAMPGTAMMLYGTMAAIILLIILMVWFFFRGHALINKLIKKWKLHRLFTSMYNMEKRFQKSLSKGISKRIILDKLSYEFREFLTVLTGVNCSSITANEFASKYIHEFASEYIHDENGAFLSNYFRRCDELRFSGTDIETQDITKLLDELRFFLAKLENERKNKEKEKIK